MISYIFSTIETQDDRDFMQRLYTEFYRLMFITAGKYQQSSADQEDIVQDSLEKLIEKVDVLRRLDHAVLASYIVTTVRNTAINFLKRQDMINGHMQNLDDKHYDLEAKSPTLEEIMMQLEDKQKLSVIWGELSPEAQFLLFGKYIYGYTDKEMALQLKCKTASIRMKLTRARRQALQLMVGNEEVEQNDKA